LVTEALPAPPVPGALLTGALLTGALDPGFVAVLLDVALLHPAAASAATASAAIVVPLRASLRMSPPQDLGGMHQAKNLGPACVNNFEGNICCNIVKARRAW